MRIGRQLGVLLLLGGSLANAQTKSSQVGRVLEIPLQSPESSALELRQYLMARVPKLPAISSADKWIGAAGRLRKRLLRDVVFHGWPSNWIEAPLKVDEVGVEETVHGYRLRKLRYEIVPGFQSVAVLYEPANLRGKVPAILNVNGHVGAPGKAVEYKQKRCINFALQGILALNLEWLSFGELAQPGNEHWFGGHLDVVGANALGLFFLAMRKGLDYLEQHPNADRTRLGVTGLSGGGWQTIVLSALDERVSVAIPVAGYASLVSRIERPGDTGDLEQNATDLHAGQDYPHLTAMRAPRPTLLIYNAEDDCCFRAPLVKPYIFDAVRPIYRLFNREQALAWHENTDPSDHNYQMDNRIQAYRFFSEHFGLPPIEEEISVDAQIKSYNELLVGLPKDNLTILGLAKKLSGLIQRKAIPSAGSPRVAWAQAEREKLSSLVRFHPVAVKHAWALRNTKEKGLETHSFRFEMNNGLSAAGAWLKATNAKEIAPITIVLDDRGKKASPAEISDRVNRGEQVLALDLVFFGDATPEAGPVGYAQMLASTGDRPIGMQAAQLIAAARWLRERSGDPPIRLESTGIRSQLVSLIASALHPGFFSEVVVRDGMTSLAYLLDTPVTYQSAPALFCLDLFKEFDIDLLAALGGSTRVVQNFAQKPVQ